MSMEFWTTDHGRGLSTISIRTESRPANIPPVLSARLMENIKGKDVTCLGIFDDDNLRDLRDAINERLQEQYGDNHG